MALTAPLSQVNVTHLDFTRNCSNIALGVKTYNDYFSATAIGDYNDTGEVPATPNNSGPTDYPSTSILGWSGWSNGPPQEWIQFWRGALPVAYQTSSDEDVAQWANTTQCLEFFDYTYNPTTFDYGDLNQVNLDDVDAFSNALANLGGCQNNRTLLAQDKVFEMLNIGYNYSFTDMIEDCMLRFCCPLPLDSTELSDQSQLFPGTTWSVQSACSFYRCAVDNMGNPDLGGIGILVAYYIEAVLLSITWAMAVLHFIVTTTRAGYQRSSSSPLSSTLSFIWDRHFTASLDAATVFLDAAVYFSLSVSFAGILFNYRGKPLLYEDKLGQASTLLALDAPVVILLLIYRERDFDRRILRCILVGIAALMTFIIQFMFRSVRSFNSLSSSSCLDWRDSLEKPFARIFIIKAIWAGLVALFFASHFLPLHLPEWGDRKYKPLDHSIDRVTRPRSRFEVRAHLLHFVKLIYSRRRSIIALILAAYGVVDSYVDINFIGTLRDAEKAVALKDEEDAWGYGQILAVLIWVPIFVEYIYNLINGPEDKTENTGISKTSGEELKYLRLQENEHATNAQD